MACTFVRPTFPSSWYARMPTPVAVHEERHRERDRTTRSGCQRPTRRGTVTGVPPRVRAGAACSVGCRPLRQAARRPATSCQVATRSRRVARYAPARSRWRSGRTRVPTRLDASRNRWANTGPLQRRIHPARWRHVRDGPRCVRRPCRPARCTTRGTHGAPRATSRVARGAACAHAPPARNSAPCCRSRPTCGGSTPLAGTVSSSMLGFRVDRGLGTSALESVPFA